MSVIERKPRQDRGIIKFTARDRELLTWIAEQYILRLDLLQLLMDRPRTTARQWMSRMRDAGWLNFRPIFADQTTYMWITRSGLEQLGLEFSYWEPSVARVRHAHWVGYTRRVLARRHPEARWDCERYIWQRIAQQRVEQQQARGKKPIHLPDAFLYMPDGGTVIIEVELSAKSVERTAETMRYHLSGPESERFKVWYVVAPEVVPTVRAAQHSLGESLASYVEVFALPAEASG